MNNHKNSKRRQELVSIAAKLFCNQGYETTTVRLLAAKMGIQSGSLFHHFQDKQEILFAVIESGMLHALEMARLALAKTTNTPQARLLALAKAHLATLLQDRDAHVVAIYEWRSLSETSRLHLVELRDAYESIWCEVLYECQQMGLLPEDHGLRRRLALGALNWTFQWYHPQGALSIDDLAQTLVEMLLGGQASRC